MTIFFCGDTHGSLRHVVKAARELKPAAVVLLGDIQPPRPLHVELEPIRDLVYFIHGNHDSDSEGDWTRVWDSELAGRNIHGRVATLPDGTRVAGLGGVFREAVWYPSSPNHPNFRTPEEHARATPRQDRWRGGRHRRHWGTIYPSEVDALADMRANILVTHEAPSCHPNGFEIIDDLARSMGASKVFHGHHHDRLDYSGKWAELGFQAFGVGLRGITDQDGTVVLQGERDDSRSFRQRYILGGDEP